MTNLRLPAIILSLIAAPFLTVSAGDLAQRMRDLEAVRQAEYAYLADARRPAARAELTQLAAAKAQSGADAPFSARPLDGTGAQIAAPSFSKIVIDATGTSTFEGLAGPGTEVTLALGSRVIGTTKPDAGGKWTFMLDTPLAAGDHRITSSAKILDQGRVLPGQEVRIAIPEQFGGTAIVAYEAPPPAAAPPARDPQQDPQRQRAEDLARAASEKFTEVIPDGAAKPRVAQVPPAPAAPKTAPETPKAPPGSGVPASGTAATTPAGGGSVTAPVTEWLDRSSKEYQDSVVKGLTDAPGGAKPPPMMSKDVPAAKPAPSAKPPEQRTAEQKPVAPAPVADPLDALTDAQIAVQDWLARANRDYQAEIMRRLETPAPGATGVASGDKPMPAPGPSVADKAAAEARAKAEEERKRLAQKQKEIEDARKAAESKAAETKRQADAAKEQPKVAAPEPQKAAVKEPPKATAEVKPPVETKAAEDALKKQADDEARQAENKRQAEIKRQADEAARKAADAKRAAEDAAKKLAEDRQRRAEEITRLKNEEEAKAREAAAKKLDEQRAAAQKLVDDEARRAREAADRAAAERKAAEAQAREADAQRDAALKAAETARRLAAETDIKAAGEKRREAEAKAAEEQRKAAESSRSAAAAQRAAEERARAAEAASAEASKAMAAAKAAELARQAVEAARSGPAKRAAERQLAEQTAKARAAATRAVAAEKDGATKAEKARTVAAKAPRPKDTRIAEGSGEKGPVDLPARRREPLDRSERSGLGVGVPRDPSGPAKSDAAATGDSASSARSPTRPRTCARAGRQVGRPGTYVVRRGDTLWDIAERHYSNGERYRLIARVNSGRISDPDVIEPCLRLWLP